MDLSIITVTYHSQDTIDRCILSVVTNTLNITYEHIVIDNNSTDSTQELIENGYLNYVTLIKNKKNLGFAAANNLGVKQAKGRYILFLNPDMQLHEGYLDTLISWMDINNDVGIVGCKLINASYKNAPQLYPLKFPTLKPYLPAFLKLKPFFCIVHELFFYQNFNDNLEQEVDCLRGAFMLMPRTFIEKLGFGFDPAYFLLLEDVDVCKEAKRLGYKVMYNPQVTCIDFFAQSFSKKPKSWKYLCVAKSFKTYVRKWHCPWHLLWIYPTLYLGFILRTPQWGWKTSIQTLLVFLKTTWKNPH